MSIAVANRSRIHSDLLVSGDRMSRAEFHELYCQTPEHFKAELIDGEVFVASPLKLRHGKNHFSIGTVLQAYENRTPGTECGDNVTVIIDDLNEPQPGAFLRILPDHGGQSQTAIDDYIEGTPELLVEISVSSKSIDLNRKRDMYARNGVAEYIVLNSKDRKIHWFDLENDREKPLPLDQILKSLSMPGLWIDCKSLLSRDVFSLLKTLEAGLASPEHAAFVQKLNTAKKA
jgi:Uma2 family endonuclease